MRIFFSSRLMFRGILIMKQRCDQHSDQIKLPGFKILPSEEEEGRSIKAPVWGVADAEDWPGDFFFLRLETLVIGNLRFFSVATSARVGAPWPILGLSAGSA